MGIKGKLQQKVALSGDFPEFMNALDDHFDEKIKEFDDGDKQKLKGKALDLDWLRKKDIINVPEDVTEGATPTPIQAMELLKKHLSNAVDHPEVTEEDGKPVKYVSNMQFKNWGLTVKNTPAVTFIPRSATGVCNIVKWAKNNDMTVRVCGYCHTWTNLFSADNQCLISILPFEYHTLPAKEIPISDDMKLQSIEITKKVYENGQEKALVKIGSATTNEQFRRWVVDNAQQDNDTWKEWWTVPLNVIMVEITWGGSNAPICHGAGWKNKTLSDLVRSIEFVNPHGELQVVSDPEQLKAAAGCFGMMGVVTSITLALDVLTYANMKPIKLPVGLAIPPPAGLEIPDGINMEGITDEDKQEAFDKFVDRCENDFYAEWFWFVLQPDVWVNTWKNDGVCSPRDYPSKFISKVQGLMEYLAEIANHYIFPHLPAKWQAHVLGGMAMKALPTNETIVTPLIDALHFQRGIQNMRVYDMEWEIPIPGLKNDPTKPDWSICQDAWWAVLVAFYKRYNANEKDIPMRLCMEMRFNGTSVW